LRCQTLVRTFDPQHWNRLAAQLNEIIEAAPDFVPAYCSLADLHSYEHIAHPGILRNHAREQRAMQLARKAVELDAAHAGARRTLAWAHAMMKQHGQAELHIQIASELNPHDSSTAVSAALLLAFCGQHRRASELSQGVLDVTVSPSPIHWALQADIQFLIGNYEAAAEAGDRANDVSWGVAAWRTASLSHLGRTAEATAEGARFITRVRANWFGSVPATDHAITHWFLHAHPIRHHADWSRLRDGLQAAGLPVEGCEFNALNEAGPDVTGRS
jgi:tetratricopeptide (TPR) repeat protein